MIDWKYEMCVDVEVNFVSKYNLGYTDVVLRSKTTIFCYLCFLNFHTV